MKPLLELSQVTIRFGGLVAVNGVDLAVQEGTIHSVIGPNGAGKTTLFNAVTGVYPPTDGKLCFCGSDIREPLRGRTVSAFCGFGIITALFALLTFNAQSLWDAAIVSQYVYQQPFPWWTAAESAIRYLVNLPPSENLLPLLFGFVVGAGGAYSVWRGWRITPYSVADLGVSRTFQNIRLFQKMTVLDNVLIGMTGREKIGFLAALLRLPAFYRAEERFRAQAAELLDLVELSDHADATAGTLSYGDQRRLEIARALALQPKLLLLDEPAAGMNPSETVALMELLRKIRDRGVTILLIEHHMNVVMGISDTITVLDYGQKIAEGSPEVVRANPRVIDAYLGAESTG